MTSSTAYDTDVLIAGAGPTGLTLATLLGNQGIKVTLVEARQDLIDYPRGVGMDDESFRTVQAMDLIDEIVPFTIPHHIMRIVNGQGEVIMTNNPKGEPFGWPRKFGFLQPMVDRAVFEGLSRFPNVEVRFGTKLVGIDQDPNGVTATLERVSGEDGQVSSGETEQLRAHYLVGCEGGRSFTRKWMGVEFEGKSPSTRWVVVDCNNDPLGFPNVYLGADPARPYVSIGLPQGVRRFEFMLFDDEPSERVEDDKFVAELLRDHLPDDTQLDIIRRRVFTHHGRIAKEFRKGRVLIAGDAAHLMPVWMGQGFNSGYRDATNLAWKLKAVISGQAKPDLLDTYSTERRDHAKAMVDLSMAMGNIIKPTDRRIAFLRDRAAGLANSLPQVRSYFEDMRFKPMPRYGRGAVVDQESLAPGFAHGKNSQSRIPKLIPARNALQKQSPVGSQFIQPTVGLGNSEAKLDNVLGQGFSIISWGIDPQRLFDTGQLQQFRQLDVRLVCAVSPTQVPWAREHCAKGDESNPTVVIADASGSLKNWFDQHAVGTVFIRPDRFTAAVCLNGDAKRAWNALVAATHLTPSAGHWD
ncbi:bifunctional 3-(3-hydroxy-phenyl)propionate/3-hydroxycinnamic acid hydroxylase [Corynebacterium lizhenjunii]|uniref:Bifunctional 3-(3-hydroxy-phenyl)propionate/3-hydroxycinnamic acid hydroxylase n=1 Tax=Corynebacterium lizhenjunii TaxID=2709394 RepID=A0A7T0KF08_9CORY|nr:bifunctional 3-(3-hydroxy-phenyl)propionate/3-hydroxycinnamic acid hydroxylase [Corynebacterium lizhenjunii]QPK79105.1 bifunctional 3-(3-hydroxy-phenyl)propionate/3-hydroxycinnamic acid hydroxylase [Corynebacterium lizhenjunii]